MSSWNQNNMQVGQASFGPYMNYLNTTPSYNRLPVYNAAPIHGEHAAWQFPMGSNSEIYLPDDEQDIIWWIRTDNYGNRTVKSFDVILREESIQTDMNNILDRLAALEEKVNAKQNKSNTKRTVDATAAID